MLMIELTDQEKRAAHLSVMRTTLASLGKRPPTDEQTHSEIACRVYTAFVTAHKASLQEAERLSLEKGIQVFPYQLGLFADEIVSTVYWYWVEVEHTPIELDDVCVNSQAGFNYMAFAQGIAAAKMVETAERALALDDVDVFAPYPPSTNRLVSEARNSFARLQEKNRMASPYMKAPGSK